MDSSTYCTSIVFGLITLLVVFTFFQAVKGTSFFARAAVLWIAVQCGASLAGYFKVTDTMIPRLLLVVVPPAALMAWLFLARPGKVVTDGMNVDLLIMLHVVRAPIGSFARIWS
ncbi:hypothetical protein LZD49_15470 [Dyadobacter sp. CY261]|uniref:hypothetical protein n=1 Tax=Dyadobacter sp. CY261 TaxID=2907203 RepID=UPI001F45EF3A|nr:hypothetical protein [Dyadobacter sp. CY261]MCF0071876.1 hypothetical protein [Dyadobacter sp. CY261]